MQRRIFRFLLPLIAAAFVVHLASGPVVAGPKEKIPDRAKCSVCGMFVAKYPDWVAQLHHNDGTVIFFDGVKDLMVYYLNPSRLDNYSRESVSEIWVRDYYSMEWINGRQAAYVIGSDVYGPMGHEFIPFSSEDAARTFMKDHHGKQVLTFDAITESLVEELRMGHKMR